MESEWSALMFFMHHIWNYRHKRRYSYSTSNHKNMAIVFVVIRACHIRTIHVTRCWNKVALARPMAELVCPVSPTFDTQDQFLIRKGSDRERMPLKFWNRWYCYLGKCSWLPFSFPWCLDYQGEGITGQRLTKYKPASTCAPAIHSDTHGYQE